MAVVSNPPQSPAKNSTPPPVRKWWEPYIWHGMTFRAWWRLFSRNQFDVDWKFMHVAAAVFGWSVLNSFIGLQQTVLFGRRVRRTKIEQPPLLVLGHWRSGTTLLHELMVLDERHASPSTYACLAPTHFLLSERFARRWLNWVMPDHRPQDKMKMSWDRAQEDEFALANLGLPSPYLTIAFPNRPPQDPEYLTMEGLSSAEREHWKQGLFRFLQEVTYKTPGRLVLKSPPHTSRVDVLLEMFPEARFVHIVRDPFVVYSSTFNLWRTLYNYEGLQTPRFEGLEEYVLATLERMYDKYERDRVLLPANRLYELRYEDLVREPMETMRRIYEQLEIDGFEALRPKIEAYLAEQGDYQVNRYPQLDPQLRERISNRWGRFFRRYGYEI